jgi:hypothetical protein
MRMVSYAPASSEHVRNTYIYLLNLLFRGTPPDFEIDFKSTRGRSAQPTGKLEIDGMGNQKLLSLAK